MRSIQRFWKDETAATAIEYSLIATLIALTIIASFSLLADQVQWLWSNNNSKIVQTLDGN